jgi:hypothetical protein
LLANNLFYYASGDGDPGQVETGHYVIEDGVVTLTTVDGEPLMDAGATSLVTRVRISSRGCC